MYEGLDRSETFALKVVPARGSSVHQQCGGCEEVYV